jgi:MFS family permease
VRGLPRQYWLLWSGMLVNRVGGFVLLYLSLYLTEARDLGYALAGLIVGGYGVGGAVGTLLGGVLADRWGRRRTLLLAHFAATGCLAVLTASSWLPALAALTVLLGVFHSMPAPAFVAAIVDVVPDADRPRAFNLQVWAFNLGVSVASLVAPLLAQFGYTLMFALDAFATLVTGFLLFFWVRETKPALATHAHGGLLAPLTDRYFMPFVGLTLLLAILGAQVTTILPLSMRDDGLDKAQYGLVTAYGTALIVLGQLFVPRLIRRWRNGPVLAFANALLALGFAAVAGAGSLAGYLVAATVWTAGSMLAAPPNATVIAELSPAELRARYQGVFFLAFPAANFIAPALGGVGLAHFGDSYWLLCGAVGAVAMLGHLLISPARERRLARQREREPAYS